MPLGFKRWGIVLRRIIYDKKENEGGTE